GDMHETVLMYADVDEGAKRGDVGNGAFEDHARLQILDFLDTFHKRGGLELGARIAAGFVQFPDDVGDRRHAEFFIDEFGWFQAAQKGAISDQAAHRTTVRSEEHTSELQSRENLVCRLLLEKKK